MNTKYLAVLSVLVIAAATIGGALLFMDQNDYDESYAIVVTDDAGKEIKLKEPLERVAVVNSNITLT
jgi:ABC-type Fe3+-hydroxamate transport system substrate-binding protein